MYRAMDTASPFAVFYFLMVIMFGTYLLTNLIIAVCEGRSGGGYGLVMVYEGVLGS